MEIEKKTDEVKTEQRENIPMIATTSVIENATNAAEKLKAENDRMEKHIQKLQELKTLEILGGKSEGRPQEVAQKQMSDREYAKMVLSGKKPEI